MEFKSGSRRWVFLIGKYAIKIPRLASWLSFISGVRENLEERYWFDAGESPRRKEWNYKYMAKIHWADRFGLLMIMERVIPPKSVYQLKKDFERMVIENDLVGLPLIEDNKADNLGYTKDGRLVFCDYGWFGARDRYIGCTYHSKEWHMFWNKVRSPFTWAVNLFKRERYCHILVPDAMGSLYVGMCRKEFVEGAIKYVTEENPSLWNTILQNMGANIPEGAKFNLYETRGYHHTADVFFYWSTESYFDGVTNEDDLIGFQIKIRPEQAGADSPLIHTELFEHFYCDTDTLRQKCKEYKASKAYQGADEVETAA